MSFSLPKILETGINVFISNSQIIQLKHIIVSCLPRTLYVAVSYFPHFVRSLAAVFIISKVLTYAVFNSCLSGTSYRSNTALTSPFCFCSLGIKNKHVSFNSASYKPLSILSLNLTRLLLFGAYACNYNSSLAQ